MWRSFGDSNLRVALLSEEDAGDESDADIGSGETAATSELLKELMLMTKEL